MADSIASWCAEFFRGLFIVLLFIFLVSGLDDLFVDVLYYLRWLFRRLFLRKAVRPLTLEQLKSAPEKNIAIMIPAWDESAVICRMLLNTIGSLDYRNYHVFVGTYPNDEATRIEVEKAREVYPNIDAIVTPADGPTNKADCLNWIFQGVLLFEKDHNVRFDIFVMHDSEDVVHPLSLGHYNYLMPRVHFIQLPVFPFEVNWTNLAAGVYLDEFAESHTKELRVRELLSSALPSAGVGTAVSREAMDFLAERNRNQVFDVRSLAEDYLMGIRLRRFPGRKIFLQQRALGGRAPRRDGRRPRRSDLPLATREYFPTTFRAAVRQKSRWVLGIALQGWSVGWTGSPGDDYFLFRDRKSAVTNIAAVLGYAVVLYMIARGALNRWTSVSVPPLLQAGEPLYKALLAVMALFFWRLVNRVGSSWRVYGPLQGVLAVPRVLYGNVLNFCATCLAIHRFIRARISGKVPEWGKTDHVFPSEEQLRGYHRRLGDLLLEQHFVSPEQLAEALRRQRESGGRLGDVLVKMGVLWEEDLVRVLARQRSERFAEVDPYSTPPALLEMVPREVAERYRIFPLALQEGVLVLAADNLDAADRKRQIEETLGRPISLRWCAAADMQFALLRGYDRPRRSEPVSERIGERLVRQGLISENALREALRRQKRTNRRLGEVLVDMGAVDEEDIEEVLKQQG